MRYNPPTVGLRKNRKSARKRNVAAAAAVGEGAAVMAAPRWIARAVRESGMIFLAALSVYLITCLATWSPADPGWTNNNNPPQIANLGGRVGAWLADSLRHGFGAMAYLFPLLTGVWAWRIFRARHAEPPGLPQRLVVAAGFLLTLISGGALENLRAGSGGGDGVMAAGGFIGAMVGGGFTSLFGAVGATVFLLVLFITGLTLFTGISWLRLMDFTGALVWRGVAAARLHLGQAVDRVVGLRARRQRRDAVQERMQKLERGKPPRIEPKIKLPEAGERASREKQTPLFTEPAAGELPALDLLQQPLQATHGYSRESLEAMSRLVEKKLGDFNVEVKVVEVHPGPVITSFEIEPAPGVKASQITGLARDLARALSVVSVRVVENIPGKTVVGLEIPNEMRDTVTLVEGLSSKAYENVRSPLTLMLGKDIGGLPVVADLCKMPHLLIAGTTGSGKSVCINALILSILYKSRPDEVRLVLVDPKMLELSIYEGIPHLLVPVVTDMQHASNALRWSIAEMERRYKRMAVLGVRNISGYNAKVEAARNSGEPIADPLAEADGEEQIFLQREPYIVIVIDELADLMMTTGKKVEELITRIAQRARASGIHLVLATQRPSVDVVTGLIKANIPGRIAFQVSSRVDSRTVLDQMGAEQLLGHGDMLFLAGGQSVPMRVHGSFVADEEVHRVVKALKKQGAPAYNESILAPPAEGGGGAGGDEAGEGENDPLYDQALRIVTETRRPTISHIQRHLRIGYNRAARMLETMEQSGVVGPMQANGKREVLAPPPAG